VFTVTVYVSPRFHAGAQLFVRVFSRGHPILTSRERMWCYAYRWDVRDNLTLNSMAKIQTSVTLLTSRHHTCQHASQISVVAHISWGVTTWHTFRVLFGRFSQLFARKHYCLCQRLYWNPYDCNVVPRLPGANSSHEIMWHEDKHVCHLTWRELTWRELTWREIM